MRLEKNTTGTILLAKPHEFKEFIYLSKEDKKRWLAKQIEQLEATK